MNIVASLRALVGKKNRFLILWLSKEKEVISLWPFLIPQTFIVFLFVFDFVSWPVHLRTLRLIKTQESFENVPQQTTSYSSTTDDFSVQSSKQSRKMPNPLHPTLLSSQQSGYSSLSSALLDYDDPYSPVMRVCQREYAPGSKWHNTLRKMDPRDPSITFNPIGSKNDLPGVRLSDLIYLRGTNPAIMVGGQDRVLASYDKNYINFRILWEGYEIWCRSVPIRKDGCPITRADLATAIATNFQSFLSKYRSVPGQNPKWSLASGRFSTERLFLIRLKTTCEGCWQADVLADFR